MAASSSGAAGAGAASVGAASGATGASGAGLAGTGAAGITSGGWAATSGVFAALAAGYSVCGCGVISWANGAGEDIGAAGGVSIEVVGFTTGEVEEVRGITDAGCDSAAGFGGAALGKG